MMRGKIHGPLLCALARAADRFDKAKAAKKAAKKEYKSARREYKRAKQQLKAAAS